MLTGPDLQVSSGPHPWLAWLGCRHNLPSADDVVLQTEDTIQKQEIMSPKGLLGLAAWRREWLQRMHPGMSLVSCRRLWLARPHMMAPGGRSLPDPVLASALTGSDSIARGYFHTMVCPRRLHKLARRTIRVLPKRDEMATLARRLVASAHAVRVPPQETSPARMSAGASSEDHAFRDGNEAGHQ